MCTFLTCFVDINECASQEALCNLNANCVNTAGAFECTCKEGFVEDGNDCKGVYIYILDIFDMRKHTELYF